MKKQNSKFSTLIVGLSLLLGCAVLNSAYADDRNHRYSSDASFVQGWRLGPGGDRSGLFIYRETRFGWERVAGSAVQIGGNSRTPWVINNRNRIYSWNGRNWDRMPGSAVAVADGWVIGTKREHGGYGIFRWNGYNWDQAPGGAVSIGGSYERPWVVNDRNQRFVWNGYDWDRAGGSHYGISSGRFQNSFGAGSRQTIHRRDRDNRRIESRRDRRRYSDW